MLYKAKDKTVQAVEWLGQEVAGLEIVPPAIVLSKDRKYFFVDGINATHWLSFESVENGTYESIGIEEAHFNISPVKVYITEEHVFAKAYLEHFKRDYPKPYGLFLSCHVHEGDFIVQECTGCKYALPRKVFFETFEDIEESIEIDIKGKKYYMFKSDVDAIRDYLNLNVL